MTFVLVLILVLLWLYVVKIGSRLDHVEKYLQEYTKGPGVKKEFVQNGEQEPDTPSAPEETQPSTFAEAAPSVSAPQSNEPDIFTRFIAWCKKDWLLKSGALLVMLGLAWFVGYAIIQGWISPEMRVVMGLAVGFFITLFGGLRLRRNMTDQGEVLIALGSTVILLSTWAGQQLYEMFPILVALGIMFAASAYVAFESVVHRRLPLALAGMTLANIAPYLVNAPGSTFTDLSLYLFVVTVGMVWVIMVSGWHILAPIGAFLLLVHSVPWLVDVDPLNGGITSLYSIFAFAVMYFVVSTIGILKRQHNDKAMLSYASTAGLIGLLLVFWIQFASPESFKAPLMLLWALAFLIGGEYLYRITGKAAPFVAYGGVSGVLIATATAVLLDGPALAIAYTLETGAVIAIGYLLGRNVSLSRLSTLLFLGPAWLSLENIFSRSWRSTEQTLLSNDDFWVLLVLIITAFGLSILFYFFKPRTDQVGAKRIGDLFITIGVIYTYILTWLIFVLDDQALLTVVYTLESLLLVNAIYLLRGSLSAMRLVSFVFLIPAFVSIGSFTSDTWDSGVFHNDFFALLALAISFVILGVLVYRGHDKQATNEQLRETALYYFIVASLFGFSLVWLALHAAMPHNQDGATTISLLIYTLIGLGTYIEGNRRVLKQMSWYGVTILLLVLIRLAIVDFWTMDLLERIITFVVVGGLFMSAAFFTNWKQIGTGEAETERPEEEKHE